MSPARTRRKRAAAPGKSTPGAAARAKRVTRRRNDVLSRVALFLRSHRSVLARGEGFAIILLMLFACKAPVERASEKPPPKASVEPVRVRRPAPSGDFDCRELRSVPNTENAVPPETIELHPPGAGKSVFTAKTGVVVR